MEANQLGGGPAVGHGPLRVGGERYDATLSVDKSFQLRQTVLSRS